MTRRAHATVRRAKNERAGTWPAAPIYDDDTDHPSRQVGPVRSIDALASPRSSGFGFVRSSLPGAAKQASTERQYANHDARIPYRLHVFSVHMVSFDDGSMALDPGTIHVDGARKRV
jgi:hypothetical protein